MAQIAMVSSGDVTRTRGVVYFATSEATVDSVTSVSGRCSIDPSIRLQLLLRKPSRTKEAVAAVRKICASIGIEPTASGAASVSGVIEPRKFESLFAVQAEIAAAPTMATPALPVPKELQEYVESVTIAPPHTYMDS